MDTGRLGLARALSGGLKDRFEVSKGPCASVLVLEYTLGAVEHVHPPLLQALLELGGDPGAPLGECVHQVPRLAVDEPPRQREWRLGVECQGPHSILELERLVGGVVRISKEELGIKACVLTELPPNLRNADPDRH
eukprot:CAMPEP_0206220076 /NCGR_PEP_ID=MMETSP0047_2-20121206/4685_1 /ASSEMBLY_ACC=CAM_ASM_000192 /TAXON_ID=195065 /ORGANISM="Chroomonas mesostigmatica_cf, Strain CCMP1168" /LENGTH=135 /DNA_ID=CAMNT_0053642713 /DNA_START=112 /DNA_END=519 /DNA_ORIENTATION=-